MIVPAVVIRPIVSFPLLVNHSVPSGCAADGRHILEVVQVRVVGLRPLEEPWAYEQLPRRVLGLDGQIRETG